MTKQPDFFADFDSGNLSCADRVPLSCCRSLSCCCADRIDLEYNLNIRPDAEGNKNSSAAISYRTWFYFGVKSFSPGTVMRLNITNMRKQMRLFRMGHKPVVKQGESGDWQLLDSDVKFWERHNFILSFVYKFPNGIEPVYFALTAPYTYGDLQADLTELRMKSAGEKSSDSPYICVETVCRTQLGLDVNLITISSSDGILDEEEDRLNQLFPDTNSPRCRKFKDKKVVFVSARVHPGEVCSSFVLRGLVEFLIHPTDVRAENLRRNFVFKLVPMLNPDGVFKGHFRGDINGFNLNRVYGSLSFAQFPSIYAAQMLLTYYHHHYFIPEFMKISGTLPHAKLLTPKVKSEQRVPHTPTKQPPTAAGCSHRSKTALNAVRRNLFGHPLSKDEEIYRCEQVATDPSRNSSVEGNLAFYFDLHGHVSKAGCFLYGNHLKPIQQVETLMFAKLMDLNCPYFDLNGSVFSQENMCHRDLNDKSASKEGAGRVAMYKLLGIIHCYTLECHYSRAKTASFPSNETESLPFTSEAYMEVGKAIGISILDFSGGNTESILSNTSTPNMSALRSWAMTSMEEQKPKKRRSLRNSTKENEDSKPRILTKRLRRCSLTLESSKESGRKVGPKRRVPPSMDVGGKAARFYDADVSGQGASGVAVRQPLKRSPIKTKFLKFKYPQ